MQSGGGLLALNRTSPRRLTAPHKTQPPGGASLAERFFRGELDPPPVEESPASDRHAGFLYVFADPSTPGAVKVGVATRVDRRLKDTREQRASASLYCAASCYCVRDYLRAGRVARRMLEPYLIDDSWYRVSTDAATQAIMRACKLVNAE